MPRITAALAPITAAPPPGPGARECLLGGAGGLPQHVESEVRVSPVIIAPPSVCGSLEWKNRPQRSLRLRSSSPRPGPRRTTIRFWNSGSGPCLLLDRLLLCLCRAVTGRVSFLFLTRSLAGKQFKKKKSLQWGLTDDGTREAPRVLIRRRHLVGSPSGRPTFHSSSVSY